MPTCFTPYFFHASRPFYTTSYCMIFYFWFNALAGLFTFTEIFLWGYFLFTPTFSGRHLERKIGAGCIKIAKILILILAA